MQIAADSSQSSFLLYNPDERAICEVPSNMGLYKKNAYFLNEKAEFVTSSIADEKENSNSMAENYPNVEITPNIVPVLQESFIEIKKWEGKISEVDFNKEIFWAFIRDNKFPNIEEETYFSFDDIDENDQNLVEEGAIFYWSIGYKRTLSGGREKVSIILFRRLPAWNIEQKKVDDKIEKLKKLFTDEHPSR